MESHHIREWGAGSPVYMFEKRDAMPLSPLFATVVEIYE